MGQRGEVGQGEVEGEKRERAGSGAPRKEEPPCSASTPAWGPLVQAHKRYQRPGPRACLLLQPPPEAHHALNLRVRRPEHVVNRGAHRARVAPRHACAIGRTDGSAGRHASRRVGLSRGQVWRRQSGRQTGGQRPGLALTAQVRAQVGPSALARRVVTHACSPL